MQEILNIIFITNHEMDGVGFQGFFEHNSPEYKVSISLLPSSYNFSVFDLSSISENTLLMLDTDDFNQKSILDFLLRIKTNKVKCVLYSKQKTPGLLLKAHQLLLSGYISKASPMSRISDCVKAISFGGSYYDSAFDSIIFSLYQLFESLSQTQRQLLSQLLLYENISITQLSQLLDISRHAAEVHLSSLYKITGVSGYCQLIKHFSI